MLSNLQRQWASVIRQQNYKAVGKSHVDTSVNVVGITKLFCLSYLIVEYELLQGPDVAVLRVRQASHHGIPG
jgi:hypothetical protein